MSFLDEINSMDEQIMESLGAVPATITTRDGNATGSVSCISNEDRKERLDIGTSGEEETWTNDLAFLVSEVVAALGRRFLTGDKISYKGQDFVVVSSTEDDSMIYATAEVVKRLSTYGNPESKR